MVMSCAGNSSEISPKRNRCVACFNSPPFETDNHGLKYGEDGSDNEQRSIKSGKVVANRY